MREISYLFEEGDLLEIPNLSNSVYSMHDIPYSHFPSKFFFSINILIPSVAPAFRLQDANPSFCHVTIQ